MSQKTVSDKTRTRGKTVTQSQPGSPTRQSPQKNTTTVKNVAMDNSDVDGGELRIEHIMARLDQLDNKLTEVKSTAIRTNTDIAKMATLLADSRREHDADKRRLQVTTHGVEQMRESNRRLSIQLNDIENRAKICNIKLDGKSEDNSEDLRRYLGEMMTHLSPDVNITDVLTVNRMGRKPLPRPGAQQQMRIIDRTRTIMIVFKNVHTRNALYFNRAKLGKIDSYRGIYLNDDVTQTTRKAREDYRSVAALARAAGSDIRVHGDGIIIDGRKYRHTDTLPERFSLARAKSVEVGGELFFHSEHSFLSNFYPTPITEGEIVYQTAEHRLQAAKCKLAKDHDRLREVIQAHTPLEAKRTADQIPDSAEWRTQRETELKETIELKFNQNPHLIGMLLATGGMKLNEATTNTYYGIGATLHSREIRDKNFKGLNKLGQALMKERETLRAVQDSEHQQQK